VAAGAINRVIRHYVHTAHAAADALRMPREAIAVISARSAAIRADLAAYRQARAWFEAACVAPIPG
jgi:hypothetical protein